MGINIIITHFKNLIDSLLSSLFVNQLRQAMILLAWNCWGLSRAESKRSLKAIVNKVCPDLLFLSEVKISSNRVKSILYSLGFYKLECVQPRGLKGGIILGWKNGVDVEIVM